jgi:hypothetical protein
MSKKSICVAVLLAVSCASASLADSPTGTQAAPEKKEESVSVIQTVLYLPFKSVVCIVGATASFPVYWLSGFDPQVKSDTAALRAQYCSLDYLFGSRWTK